MNAEYKPFLAEKFWQTLLMHLVEKWLPNTCYNNQENLYSIENWATMQFWPTLKFFNLSGDE